jgi:hypothetical protein
MRRAVPGLLPILLVAGCAGGGGGARPAPSPVGVPVAPPLLEVVDAAGGVVATPDGAFTVVIPPGALTGPVDVTITQITNTSPGGVGPGWRLGPPGLSFLRPVSVVVAPGLPLDPLVVSWQEPGGFWLRLRSVVRDAGAGTLTAALTATRDVAVTTARSDRDLQGLVSITDTTGLPATVTGALTLDYAGEDGATAWYVLGGALQAPATIAVGADQCTPGAAEYAIAANLVELQPTRLLWGTSGIWTLACDGPSGPSAEVLAIAFDTLGVSHPTCARSDLTAQVLAPDHLEGHALADCGAAGTIDAAWSFLACVEGAPCEPAACRTGALSCAGALPVCVDTGQAADGAPCGTGLVCEAGACVPAP